MIDWLRGLGRRGPRGAWRRARREYRPWQTQRSRAKLPRSSVGLHSDEERNGFGPAAARDRQVDISRSRIDGQIVDHDLLGIGAEHRGNLAGDVLDLELALFCRLGVVAGVDREERRPCGIAHEQNAVGPEGKRPGRLQIRFPFLEAAIGLCAHGHGSRQAQSRHNQHGIAKSIRGHVQFSFDGEQPDPNALRIRNRIIAGHGEESTIHSRNFREFPCA